MIDTHCHIAGDEFAGDLAEVVARAQGAGLTQAIVIIAADDARVDLTDLCEDFAGAVIFDVNLLKALVRRAFAERGKMRNRGHDFV